MKFCDSYYRIYAFGWRSINSTDSDSMVWRVWCIPIMVSEQAFQAAITSTLDPPSTKRELYTWCSRITCFTMYILRSSRSRRTSVECLRCVYLWLSVVWDLIIVLRWRFRIWFVPWNKVGLMGSGLRFWRSWKMMSGIWGIFALLLPIDDMERRRLRMPNRTIKRTHFFLTGNSNVKARWR